jgi:hypothetical protein
MKNQFLPSYIRDALLDKEYNNKSSGLLADKQEFINNFLAIAQEMQPAQKPADVEQQQEDLNLYQAKSKEIAKQLLANLKAQINGQSLFSAEKDNAELRPTHLVDLDALINFIAFNKIKLNEAYIAISNTNPEVIDKTKYVQYNKNFWVLKDALITYLKDLQAKNIPILNTMISKLIDQANAAFKLTISKEHPKPVTGPTKPETQVAGPTDPPTINPTPDNKGNGQGSNQQVNVQELINQAVSTLPFDLKDIDFQRINSFLSVYKEILDTIDQKSFLQNKAIILQASAQIPKYMAMVQSTTNPPRSSFPIQNVYPETLQTWLKPPPGKYVLDMLFGLTKVIVLTNDVVTDFYNSYFRTTASTDRNARRDPVQKQLVFQQSSIFNQNNEELSRLTLQIKEQLRRK